MSSENLNLFLKILDQSIAPLCTLLAGFLGVKYGLEQIRVQNKINFLERQLREFYSPLLAYREEIRAKSVLRLKISNAANETWKEVCNRNPKPFLNHEQKFEPYRKITEYNNEQLKNELLPLYRKMLSIFGENLWLAEPKTHKWYAELCDFVELWNRWISQSIPADVIKKLEHSEEKLKPFYQELEEQASLLRRKLV